MTRCHCPYCGKDDLNWDGFKDRVEWSEDDSGFIVTDGVLCCDMECEGSVGFTIRIPFTTDDKVEYLDGINGEEIKG